MSTIWVYEKPQCAQCAMTKRTLQRAGLDYKSVDLTTNADALAWIMDDLGFKQAPVVVVGDPDSDDFDAWSGFRPDKLQNLA